jgi:translation initiation factor eIF-2B subunit alpha
VGLPLPQRSAEVDAVVREFHEALARSSDMAVAVAAIQALTTVIKKSGSTTMMGLERELKDAASSLQNCNPTAISLKAGCELFLRYTTRTSALEADTFAAAKKRLIERGQHFAGAPPAPSLLMSSGKDPGNASRACYGCACR